MLAARENELFAYDQALASAYHALAGGKWDRMMSQPHLGYTAWYDPPRNVMPAVSQVEVPREGELAIAVEGTEIARGPATLPALDSIDRRAHYVDLYNRGETTLVVTPVQIVPWLRISYPGMPKTLLLGPNEDVRVEIEADWDRVPPSARETRVWFTGSDGRMPDVAVPLVRHDTPAAAGFVETEGVVSIEAEHYSRSHAPEGREWLRIPDFGRTLSAMTPMPVEAPAATLEDGMQLEYAMHLFDAGKVTVHAILAPTQKFQPGPGLRYAISFDDDAPQVVNVHADESREHWSRTVLDGVTELTTTHAIAKPGPHVLKYWALDSGLVLEKIVVDAGGMKPSYLGPPESPRIQ
jgi:hypothetical protein